MIVSGIFFGIASGIQETYYAAMMELVPYKKRTFFIGKLLVPVRITNKNLRYALQASDASVLCQL